MGGDRRRGHRAGPCRRPARRGRPAVRPAARVGTPLGRAVPVPRREDAVVLREREARPLQLLRLQRRRRRHHLRPGDRAPRLRRRRRVAGRPGRHQAALHERRRGPRPPAPHSCWSRPWSRRSTGTTSACSTAPDARPARDYLRSRGHRRRRRAPLPARLGARRLGRARPGPAACPTTCARDTGLGFVNRRDRLQDCVPGPGAVPDLRRGRRRRRLRRPDPARQRRPGEVQELARDARSTPRPRCSTASTGPRPTS